MATLILEKFSWKSFLFFIAFAHPLSFPPLRHPAVGDALGVRGDLPRVPVRVPERRRLRVGGGGGRGQGGRHLRGVQREC